MRLVTLVYFGLETANGYFCLLYGTLLLFILSEFLCILGKRRDCLLKKVSGRNLCLQVIVERCKTVLKCRYVILPTEIAKRVPAGKILSESGTFDK